MMPSSLGTGMERVGVVGPDLDLCWASLSALGPSGLKEECCNVGQPALGMALLYKNREEGGLISAQKVLF